MSSRKVREKLRERRMAYARAVEEGRKVRETAVEPAEAPKKSGRPKKKVD